MSGGARTAPSCSPRRWASPLDPTAYDRSPGLSPAERRAVAEGVAHAARTSGAWPAPVLVALQRLLTPVDDVLAHIGTPPKARPSVRLDLRVPT